MNRDFVEMLDALSVAGADFLVVGAHALAAHGRPRATGDLDLWIRPTAENAGKVWQALITFGAPLDDLRAWSRRDTFEVAGRALPFLSREDLIRNKKALGRPRDLADVDDLERG